MLVWAHFFKRRGLAEVETAPVEAHCYNQATAMATATLSNSGIVSPGGPEWIAVPGWQDLPWLWSGFSTRRGGVSRAYLRREGVAADAAQGTGGPNPEVRGAEAGPDCAGELNLGFTAADAAENVRENRRRLVAAVTGNAQTELVILRQVHSAATVLAGSGVNEEEPCEADGILTDRAGLLLGIQTADCVPVLVVDAERRVVAGFHAGWRGTAARVVELGIAKMRAEFGCTPAALRAAIGPCIRDCCYTVGAEVREAFTARFAYAEALFSGARLDLVEANRRQLIDAGLSEGSIATVGGCTSCHPELFFSHRASGGHAGRMMAVIGMRAD